MSFTVTETPRYLTMKNKPEEATAALCKLRQLPEDHPFIQSELLGVKEQLEREAEATHGVSRWGKVRELLFVGANRYRLMLGIMAQILGQWSGASSITIYAPSFFATLGYTGESEKLFATCIIGVVKLTSAYLSAFFLIEFIGRRRSLYAGITLQMLSILYVAIFLAMVPSARLQSDDLSATEKRAATGAVAMLYITGVGWTMGWNSFQYLVNAEVWPLRLRALGGSLVMCFHFINQFGNTKAVPLMIIAMTSYGFFAFCAAVCFLGIVWVWLFVPELAGRSLESTDELFNLPWYKIGRQGGKLAPDTEAVREHTWANEKREDVAAEAKGLHVEEARRE